VAGDVTDDCTTARVGDGADGRDSRDVVVRPLTHELLDDWLAFFDGDAFADNPDWCDCYCQFFHVYEEAVWESRTAAQNRAASVEMIQSRRMHGYLAYLDGRPVGWCHAAPRSQLPRIAGDAELAAGDGSGVGAIVCFLIAAPARRRGVASALLAAACAGFRQQGFAVVEAYPSAVAAGDAANYHGPLELYLRAGFERCGEAGDFVIVRRELIGVNE
jgi:GNAT superfamily N-acetyltransferase